MSDKQTTGWQRLPPIPGKMKGCLCCGRVADVFPPEAPICVGFGVASLTKNGATIWTEDPNAESEEDWMTGAQAEATAAADPDQDWRIVIYGPLSGRTYQRHDGVWALVEQNQGFA